MLYSFRRCPYAMRARMALAASGQVCELRDILLRERPEELYAASPKGTVPVLVLEGGRVIDESLEVMLWSLGRSDPEGWLGDFAPELPALLALISECDGEFKRNLDGYKYASRGDASREGEHRTQGAEFLVRLDRMLDANDYLFGAKASLADVAIFPFVRQFAYADKGWFDEMPWPHLRSWLEGWLASPRFVAVMKKGPIWRAGDAAVWTCWAE
ncbi:MAG: glutathione S-transferase [Bacteroidia bacterium]